MRVPFDALQRINLRAGKYKRDQTKHNQIGMGIKSFPLETNPILPTRKKNQKERAAQHELHAKSVQTTKINLIIAVLC